MNYRADIDGLRALAVVSVLVFHLNERFLSGGFVGVDIFFVISGYLITKLIYSELLSAQSFSFKRFYLRRLRRLFPAMAFTFVFCLILSYLLFSPQHLANFGQSLVSATLSFSNFFFWSESSYFDQENYFKPLLHTWSLSVEEQFYFIWPSLICLLYFCFKRKSQLILPIAITSFGLLSLYLNYYFLLNEETLVNTIVNKEAEPFLDVRSTLFYLLPFRVFEFALGAIIVWAPSPKDLYKVRETLFLVGLALIIYALINFNDQTIFPSFNALLPCVGATLIMYSGPQHRLVLLFSNRMMVGVGLISYSLYLIHWPIIVFYRYWKYKPISNLDYLVITSVSVLLAILMYRYIEQPFRHKKLGSSLRQNNKPYMLGSFLTAFLLCGIAFNAYSSSGWLWRFPADVVKQLDFKPGDYHDYFWKSMYAYEKDFAKNGKTKVLIVGDSMAADLSNVIVEGRNFNELDIATFLVQHNCRGLLPLTEKLYTHLYAGNKTRCKKEHQRLKDDARLRQADAIILASYWWERNYIYAIASTIEALNKTTDAKVLLSGLKSQTSNGIHFLTKHAFSAQNHKIRTPPHPNTLAMNRAMQQIKGDFIYFDLMDQFCDPAGCQRVTDDGYLIIFDESHLSPYGAKFVGSGVSEAPWFTQIVEANQEKLP